MENAKLKDFNTNDLLDCIKDISEILETSIVQVNFDLTISNNAPSESVQKEWLITAISDSLKGFEQIKDTIKNMLVEENNHD